MEKEAVKIVLNSEDNYDALIELKGITRRNVLILQEIFGEYVKQQNENTSHMSDEQKQQQHHDYRIYPSVTINELIKKQILILEPEAVFI